MITSERMNTNAHKPGRRIIAPFKPLQLVLLLDQLTLLSSRKRYRPLHYPIRLHLPECQLDALLSFPGVSIIPLPSSADYLSYPSIRIPSHYLTLSISVPVIQAKSVIRSAVGDHTMPLDAIALAFEVTWNISD